MSHCQLTFSAGFELEPSGRSAQCHPGRLLERPEGQKMFRLSCIFSFSAKTSFFCKKTRKSQNRGEIFFSQLSKYDARETELFLSVPWRRGPNDAASSSFGNLKHAQRIASSTMILFIMQKIKFS